MPNKNLPSKLIKDYPDISFKPAQYFRWVANKKTIYYDTSEERFEPLLLHELAHATLQHNDSVLDIELVNQEAKAWQYASDNLADKYGVEITEDDIKNALNSYRNWLHRRSTCPDCSSSSLQTKNTHYKCLACGCSWTANDARTCGLKRYRVN